jgi:transketolase
VIDGETGNSTFSEKFQKEFPERYFEMYIAEQNMIGVALGLSKIGFKPYASTFAAFLTRAFDQVRMAQYSDGDVNICGSHAGVSIGQDGASQMGLEDISMMRSILDSTVLYPSDPYETLKLVELANTTKGIVYIRTTREKLPILYSGMDEFKIGGSKVVKQSEKDAAVIFAAGITLHEALKAYETIRKEGVAVAVIDLYSVKPLDEKTVAEFITKAKNVIVVEDHYPYGGIGEAIANVITNYKLQITNFRHLCVRKIPHSGAPDELLRFEEIDSEAIVKTVRSFSVKS